MVSRSPTSRATSLDAAARCCSAQRSAWARTSRATISTFLRACSISWRAAARTASASVRAEASSAAAACSRSRSAAATSLAFWSSVVARMIRFCSISCRCGSAAARARSTSSAASLIGRPADLVRLGLGHPQQAFGAVAEAVLASSVRRPAGGASLAARSWRSACSARRCSVGQPGRGGLDTFGGRGQLGDQLGDARVDLVAVVSAQHEVERVMHARRARAGIPRLAGPAGPCAPGGNHRGRDPAGRGWWSRVHQSPTRRRLQVHIERACPFRSQPAA